MNASTNQANTQVTPDQEVKRWTKVDADARTVTKHHVTQHGKEDNKTFHELTWTFDFSKVTEEQLLELASRDVVIKTRPQFKECDNKEIGAWADRKFDVAAMMERERKSLPPLEKAKRAVQGLSDKEREELLAALQEK